MGCNPTWMTPGTRARRLRFRRKVSTAVSDNASQATPAAKGSPYIAHIVSAQVHAAEAGQQNHDERARVAEPLRDMPIVK